MGGSRNWSLWGFLFFDRDGGTQAQEAVFVEREDDEKERADGGSRGKQQQRADSSG